MSTSIPKPPVRQLWFCPGCGKFVWVETPYQPGDGWESPHRSNGTMNWQCSGKFRLATPAEEIRHTAKEMFQQRR